MLQPNIKHSKAVAEANKKRANSDKETARAEGRNIYVGKPCKRGHSGERYVSNSQCVECLKLKTKRLRKSKPEQFEQYNRKSWLKKAYGLTVEEFEQMVEAQSNKCAICEKDLTNDLHVDHCHSTGKVRGLLCSACNKGIGHFGDSSELLIKAAGYCKHHANR